MPINKITADKDLPRNATRLRLEQHLEERQKILELVTGGGHHIDPISVATAVSTRTILEQIEVALDRVAAGTYGTCVRCGARIGDDRLEVLPYTDACVHCQRKQ